MCLKMISTGDQSSDSGIIIPYPYTGEASPNYDDTSYKAIIERRPWEDEDVIIKLPPNIAMDEIKWLSVWCRKFSVSFGEIQFPTPSITRGTEYL